ncbi:MAG: PEP-CTERM sorting domain-containing protein, partial [Nitrospiria bacterium]
PAQYLFNLGDGNPFLWNGTEQIVGTGFWPQQGAISHIAFYGKTTTTSVPEPTMLLLLGSGLLGLGTWGALRKKGLASTI